MDIVGGSYLPGDPRLVDQIVYELKSQGIFDQFRKECFADVDTKPAYQNLRQRVEGSVTGFLKAQSWKPDMNKNQVREMLRKSIYESGFLETGVERIVDQVVNPKINTVFLPKVEEVVYNFLGIQKPGKEKIEIKEEVDSEANQSDLLPTDLEAVSPESETFDKKEVKDEDTSQDMDDSKADEDESPPFEPLDEQSLHIPQEENSIDSHISGFSGLASHESNHSTDVKPLPVDFSQQDSQNSSESRLSIVTSEDNNSKMDICEDSQTKSVKSFDSSSKLDQNSDSYMSTDKDNKNVPDEISNKKNSNGDKNKSDKDASRHKSDSKRTDKDKRSDKDRKSSRDSKSRHSSSRDKDKNKSRERKDSKSSGSGNKNDKDKDKNEKDKDKSRSDKERSSSSKSSSKHSSSKDRSSRKDSSSSSRDKNHKDDKSKSRSDSNQKHKSSSSSSTTDKDKKNDKHHSKSKDKKKDKKDDHYGSKEKRTDRRSTDRDSNDGHSSTKSANLPRTNSSNSQKNNQNNSTAISNNGSGDSGNSDKTEVRNNSTTKNQNLQLYNNSKMKLIKPKCASNIHEAMRLMKIRRQLAKLEKQNQLGLASVQVDDSTLISSSISLEILRLNGLKVNNECEKTVEKANGLNIIVQPNKVVSQVSWDAMEAKLQKEVNADYNSYQDQIDLSNSDESNFVNDEDKLKLTKMFELIDDLPCKYIGENDFKGSDEFLLFIKSYIINLESQVEKLRLTNNNCHKNNIRQIDSADNKLIKRKINHDLRNNNNNNVSNKKRKMASMTNCLNNISIENKIDGDHLSNGRLSLPLSPESDNEKCVKRVDALKSKNKAVNNQRYSSDDLYKPRPIFSASRRRGAKNIEN